jgi:hypothetical protein
MAAFLDNCRFVPTAGGTTDWVYSTTVAGSLSPTAANAVNGTVYKYLAISADLSQMEMGEGAYNSSTGTFARTTVLYNSSNTGTKTPGQSGAGTKISFTAAPQVAIIGVKEDLISIEEANSFTDTQKKQVRQNVYAAPFDAMAYSGMQFNGSLEVDQEHVGNAVTLTNHNFAYVIDGVYVTNVVTGSNPVVSIQQVASVFPGYAKELKLTVSTVGSPTSGDFIAFRTPIEGYRFNKAMWGTSQAQPVTAGFWVKSSVAGSMNLRMENNGGGSFVDVSVTITAANTAQYITATFPAQTTWTGFTDYRNGALLSIWVAGGSPNINIVSSTSNTFEWTGLTILPGLEVPSSTRAPFIARPFGQELDLSQRYYEKTYSYFQVPQNIVAATNIFEGMQQLVFQLASGTISNGSSNGASFNYKKSKRLQPTVTMISPVTGLLGKAADLAANADITASAASPGTEGIRFWGGNIVNTGPTLSLGAHFVLDARM